jgi:hypothetical protein
MKVVGKIVVFGLSGGTDTKEGVSPWVPRPC